MRQLDLFGIFAEEAKPAKKPEQLFINEEQPVVRKAAIEQAEEIDAIEEDGIAVNEQQEDEEIVEPVILEVPPIETENVVEVINSIVDTAIDADAKDIRADVEETIESFIVEELLVEQDVVIMPVEIAQAPVEEDIIDFTQPISYKPTDLLKGISAKPVPIKIPGRRGRKSFKEIDAGLALVEVPDDDTLFQKMYYPISQVAKWFNVNASLLRFWENEFDVLQPRKNRKGDRLFRPEDVKSLQVIYFLLRQRKFSIEGAKRYMKQNKNKAEVNIQLIQSLTKMRSFFLELKANLGE